MRCLALVVVALLASDALAERPALVVPVEVTPIRRPSLSLPAGTVQTTLTAEIGVSRASAFAPSSLAPDVAVGLTDDLTLALVHSTAALTGFRGSAGAGICFTGAADGCHRVYTGGGLELLYNVLRGPIALAPNLGVVVRAEPLQTDLKVGFKAKLGSGRVYLLAAPSAWLVLGGRETEMTPHEHQLWLPVSGWVKATQRLALGIGSGMKGPVDRFGERWSVPVGGVVTLTLDRHVAVGASLIYGKALGAAELMDTGSAARALQLWMTITSG